MLRKLMIVMVVLSLVVLSAALAFAEKGKKPEEFKLGFMSSLSGTFAAVAETQKQGVLLAVDQINKRGGLNMPWGKVKVTAIVKDDEAKLDIGVRRFREMVDAGINAIVGTVWNPMAAAINEECKVTPIPYIAACVPALDSFKKGNPAKGTFSVAFTPWSIGYLGGAAAINKLGKKKIFFLSRADSWGSTMYEGLQAAVKEYGGEIVGFAEVPKGNVDFTSVINKAIAAKPDIFMAAQFAGDAIACFKQAYDMGLYDVCTVFNMWITNVVAAGIPENALDGLYALTYYYYDLEGFEDKDATERAKAYTKDYMAMWNTPPDSYATIAYVAAQLLFQAVEKAGTFDNDAVAKVLSESKDLECVKGKVYFRPDHEMVAKYLAYIVRGKSPSERSGKWDVFKVEGYYGGASALPPLEMLGY